MTIAPQTDWSPFDTDTEKFVGNDPISIFGRILTRAEAAETNIVGMMLRYHDHARTAVQHLSEKEFVFTPARITFSAIGEVIREGREPELASVLDAIVRAKQQHQFPENNPGLFIYEAFEIGTGGCGLEYFIGLVRDLAAKRELISILAKFQDEIDTREPAGHIANRFIRSAGSVADRDATSLVVSLKQSSINVANRIDSLNRTGAIPQQGVATGIADLDKMTGGFQSGQLIILAARPSVGKSALAGLLARNVAQEGGRVLFFSLEMNERELTERMLAMTAGVPLSAIRGQRRINPDEVTLAWNVLTNEFPQLPFAFIDRRGLTAEELASDARAYARANGELSLIVIDYLQLLKSENPRDPRHLQIGMSTKTARNLAGELKCPVLCLAQLNREVESRGGAPRLSDLRDSGEIEQDADVVMFLHRLTSDRSLPVHDIDLIIEKQRNGPIGTVELSYSRSHTRFTERHLPM